LFLLIIVGIFIYAFVKAKSRMHYASTQHARRDLLAATEARDSTLPSWINNKDRMDEFLYAIVNWRIANLYLVSLWRVLLEIQAH